MFHFLLAAFKKTLNARKIPGELVKKVAEQIKGDVSESDIEMIIKGQMIRYKKINSIVTPDFFNFISVILKKTKQNHKMRKVRQRYSA